ncbi:predicted protein [Enterococcus casseliflavus EC30]|nr:predicted protein [Enterococcus casseliflavus EC30]EEV37028.1 predicted protein [Enterococcus casseliflavus EC10]RHH54488.1 hypothetical protein DW201_11660 [Enterococcus casseliflavus]
MGFFCLVYERGEQRRSLFLQALGSYQGCHEMWQSSMLHFRNKREGILCFNIRKEKIRRRKKWHSIR